MNRVASIVFAVATISFSSALTGAAWAGSVAMDDEGNRIGEIQAYVDLYGKASEGNQVALNNLRVLSRLYDTETLIEAADQASETHGVLVYPAEASDVADTSSPYATNRRDG